jgi:hypothetical protein
MSFCFKYALMKIILLFIFLATSIYSSCQKVTYKSLIGTSWVLFDSARGLTMTFTFLDSTHLSQKSKAVRYQQVMETIMKYSLDANKDRTLLNVEWEGEVLKCTTCTVKMMDSLLIIQSLHNSKVDKLRSKTEALESTWVFKKIALSNK